MSDGFSYPIDPATTCPERNEFDYPPGTLADRAKAVGISMTKRRRAIIQVLEAAALAGHRLTADQITLLAQEIEPELRRGAVTLALRRLRHAALVERQYGAFGVTYATARAPAAVEAEIKAMKWFGVPAIDGSAQTTI